MGIHNKIVTGGIYRQVFSITHTKSQNLNVSGLVLQLSLPNPLKRGVKSRMKIGDAACYIWVINNFIVY